MRQEECKEQMNKRDSTFVWNDVIAGKYPSFISSVSSLLYGQ
jgi:hypothetical protein